MGGGNNMIGTHCIGDLTTSKLNHHFNNMICGSGKAYGAEIKYLQCYLFFVRRRSEKHHQNLYLHT